MSKKVVVAIDLGTTGNRVAAFSRNGSIVAKSYYEFPQIFPRAGWVEHDPLAILSTTFKALREVLCKIKPENVVCIGLTNQRETSILWDKHTGKPVYNAIVWQDRRTEDMCRKLKFYQKEIKERTGLFIDPYFSATKIQWIIKNVPGVADKIKKGEILFGTLDTWLLWHLTGRRTHCTEPSNASRTMLLNIHTGTFDPRLLEIFGIPEVVLPAIKASDADFGVTDKRITGREIPITGILGDQQAALFAHCGWEEKVLKATYGTGIFVMAYTGEKISRSSALINTIAWNVGGKISYALEGSIFMGGASVQWLRDNLRIIEKAADTEKAAVRITANEGVYFVPAFQGLGAPYWDSSARGLLIGLTRKTGRDTIIRAVLESMAYQVRDVATAMQQAMKKKFNVLRVDGGACVNNVLMQFQSDMTDMKIERPVTIEKTALGAAGISGIKAGFWTRKEYKKIIRVDRVFTPKMAPKLRDNYYRKWQDAVSRSRRWEE